MSSVRLAPLLLAALLVTPAAGEAQVRASELASVTQTIDGTRISLEYSRPRARGRTDMFGGEVKWSEVWTPGANWATTLETNKDIQINQHPVPKGKYSVWMVVRQEHWTFVLDPRPRLFHMAHPDSAANQIRFDIDPVTAPFTEILTWSFPTVTSRGAAMTMAWGSVLVPLEVTVTPTYSLSTTAAAAKPYLGTYSFAWGDAEPGDSLPITLTVSYEDQALIGTFTPELWPGAGRFVMIATKQDLFLPGWLVKGELYDVERGMAMEFARKDGKAVSFDVRSEKDELIAKGARKP